MARYLQIYIHWHSLMKDRKKWIPLPTFLIAFVLPIAPALLIFFHDAVNSFLPLPSLRPPMPPLFLLFLSFPAFLGCFGLCLLDSDLGSDEAPVRRRIVAFAKAADIRTDACRKHLARKWERSEGESGAKPASSRIASCCRSSRKAKAHRNLAA